MVENFIAWRNESIDLMMISELTDDGLAPEIRRDWVSHDRFWIRLTDRIRGEFHKMHDARISPSDAVDHLICEYLI